MQAVLDASRDPGYGLDVVAVGSDRSDAAGLTKAQDAGVETFTVSLKDFDSRELWDQALTDHVAKFEPDLVILAGFMKLNGPIFLSRFAGRTINTHPALSPSFPGTKGPADALAYGVKVTGATLFFIDEGVDEGAVLAQCAVPVEDDDTVEVLHERIKVSERAMLVDTVAKMLKHGWTTHGRKVTIP